MKSPNTSLNSSTTDDLAEGGALDTPKRRYFMVEAGKNPFDEKPDEDENEDFFSGSWVKIYDIKVIDVEIYLSVKGNCTLTSITQDN
jgi:hypothetical protein